MRRAIFDQASLERIHAARAEAKCTCGQMRRADGEWERREDSNCAEHGGGTR